ncbi:MAG: CIA30 family protein [Limisphaerales bacterium]
MKSTQSNQRRYASLWTAFLLLGAIGCDREHGTPDQAETPLNARSAPAPLLLDDYSDAGRNLKGAERLLFDDKTAGSQSRATVKCRDGVLSITGDLIPGRGVPAFMSAVSPVSPDGTPKDMSAYEGIRLRVKGISGILSVQIATSAVTNFDYHASAPITGATGGDFREVRIPFNTLKRAWSEQTALDLKTVTSVNLVSFAMSKTAFAYEVDELGFY